MKRLSSFCLLSVVLLSLVSCGNPVVKVDEYSPIIRVNPDEGDRHFNRGVSLVLLEREAEAVVAFEHAVAIDPEDREAWFWLAEAYVNTGDMGKIRGAYASALEDGPVDVLHNRLANGYFNIDQHETAVREYKLALVDDEPRPVRSLANLGACFIRLKRYDEAVLPLERAVALLPESAAVYKVYYKLGIACHQLEQYEKAEKMYDLSLEHHPENAEIRLNRALLYLESGKREKAVRELSVLKRIDSEKERYLEKQLRELQTAQN